MRQVRIVRGDLSPRSVDELDTALVDAVNGHEPAVLPLGPEDPPPVTEVLDPVDDEVAVLVATSGSSARPKTVLLSARALRASASATHHRLGGHGRWLLALPPHHVAGVQVLLRSRLAGREAAVMDLRGGFRAGDFAAATGRAGARFTSLVPTQLRRLLDSEAGTEALQTFAAVLVGGSAVDPGLAGRAREAGVRLVATYGMSETCGGCVYDGWALEGVRVALENTAAEDQVGRILLGGTVTGWGYRLAPDAPHSAASDPGVTPDPSGFGEDGWFRTSDLGRWADDGRLEVLGRADDVIITGGENVAPARVEQALLAIDGVREACVVGVPDPEWGEQVAAAVVAAPTVALDPESVRAAVAPSLARATPRIVRVLDSLPHRGVGKPDRVAVRALLTPDRRAEHL